MTRGSRTVTPGFMKTSDGTLRAGHRTDYADPSRSSEFTIYLPIRGSIQHRKATPSQVATFVSQMP